MGKKPTEKESKQEIIISRGCGKDYKKVLGKSMNNGRKNKKVEKSLTGNTETIIWNPDDYYPGNETPTNERLWEYQEKENQDIIEGKIKCLLSFNVYYGA